MQVDNLNIGDNLLSAGENIRLEAALCTGLIAPVTQAGTLVVDGVPTSDCKFAFGVAACSDCNVFCQTASWVSDLDSQRHMLCFYHCAFCIG